MQKCVEKETSLSLLSIVNLLLVVSTRILMYIFPVSFIDKLLKIFSDKLRLKRPQLLTAEQKILTLVLPFLEELPVQTRKKLQKVLKRTSGCCRLQR